MSDALLRFSFDGLPVRGAIARLQSTWQSVRLRNAAPQPAQQLLGEALAASAVMVSSLKIDGRLSLQLQGSGDLTLLVAECTSDGGQRGVTHCNDEMPADWTLQHLGSDSHLNIAIEDFESNERYQGIVALESSQLAVALEHYFERSEQLATRLWLVADNETAAALMLQKLPDEKTADPDGWNRLSVLATTLSLEELLALEPETVLRRLFAEEQLRTDPPRPLRFDCPCSRKRVSEVLLALGRSEISGEGEQADVTVDCEFCNERYRFDAVDLELLFNE